MTNVNELRDVVSVSALQQRMVGKILTLKAMINLSPYLKDLICPLSHQRSLTFILSATHP